MLKGTLATASLCAVVPFVVAIEALGPAPFAAQDARSLFQAFGGCHA